ncbi:MAG TPA: tripartite tricarboxylate transporter substrate binding protein [Beijerinckiaceae bacterium]|jgi:tripartite-type tricarboxylate transporter receptor subunit TctC|nr:tripartite tricarboxylate transporter substrate binding protein [Beijerinckiaceae bacterium]
MKRVASGLLATVLLACAVPVHAQDYPSKAIKMIVPFAAGGPADLVARVIGEKLSSVAGQPVVIENRGGAGGMTGIGQVAKADRDGYTIGIASSGTLALNVALKQAMPYDPLKDLYLVTQAVSAPELLVVGPKVPAKDFKEFVALARAQPGKLNFASSGNGGMPHLAAELLKIATKTDMVHVPYPGAAPAVNDLLGGHVQLMFADVPVLLGAVQAGQLRAIAVGSKNRVPLLADVPTTAEVGEPDVLADNWYGVVAPAGLPQAVAQKLYDLSIATLRAPDVKDRLEKQGLGVVGSSSAEFTAYVRSEIGRWGKVVEIANVKIN